MSGRTEEFNLKEYMDKIVQNDLEKFKMLVKWSDEDKKHFKELLDELAGYEEKETAKHKGDKLEKLVEFVIKKTYFLEIYKNVHTETNEIDEVITLSDRGRQALEKFGISRNLIPIKQDIFLGECKNYISTLGVTYVGKFYSLMVTADVSFGIIFTQKGLTGASEGYKDAYGLTKLLRMIEKIKGNEEFYILTFTLEDYKKMLSGVTFFELIKAKKLELQLASDYNKFIMKYKHESEGKVKEILAEII